MSKEDTKIKNLTGDSSTGNNIIGKNDINFEELIRKTSVMQPTLTTTIKSSSTITTTTTTTTATTEKMSLVKEIDSTTTTTSSNQKQSNLIKITPKPISGTITKNPTTGQFVLIQSKSGGPVRLDGSGGGGGGNTISNNTSTAISSQKSQAIQVIRRADGNLVPIKTNKPINLKNVSIDGKKIITTNLNGSPTTFILKSSSGSSGSSQNKVYLSGSNKSIIQTMSVSGLQKNKLQKNLPAVSEISKSGEVTKKNQQQQQFIKVSQLSSSNSGMQTIQIPNKSGGFKYVRVVNAKETINNNKVTLLRQGDKMVAKIHQQSNSQHSKTNVSNNNLVLTKDATGVRRITTIPTLKKINDIQVTNNLLMANKDSDDSIKSKLKSFTINGSNNNNNSQTIGKPRILNNNNGVLSTQIANEFQKRSSSKGQFVVVSQELFRTMKFSPKKHIVQQPKNESPKKLFTTLKPSADLVDTYRSYPKRTPSPEGGIRRKHCNCTKSQCLKLYCDCFANGEFCQDCNCKECFNDLEYEDERQKAIKMCIERNPAAFKPKITKSREQSDIRLHNKGCNCKRSGCLKNYCECYEAKIACSSNCKCLGCRNIEDRTTNDMVDVSKIAKNYGRGVPIKRPYDYVEPSSVSVKSYTSGPVNKMINVKNYDDTVTQQQTTNKPYNFITQDVVDATIQCMIAQADECQKSVISPKQTERMILEELGRCLVEIIDFSIRNID